MEWDSLLPSTWNWIEAYGRLQTDGTFLRGLTDLFILSTVYFGVAILAWAFIKTIWSIIKTGLYFRKLPRIKNADRFPEARKDWASKKGHLAQEFDDLLVDVPKGDGSLELELKRCGDAGDVFNERSLAHGIIGNRFLMAMPGILTGVGVLGTFVGLQLGIGTLDLEESGLEELDKSIKPLIKGAATAFSTSVWGVLSSLIFAVLEKFFEQWARWPIHRLQRRLNGLVPRYLPEESMIDLQRSSLEKESALKGLAVAIGEQMQMALDRIGNSVTEAVRDALGGQAQDLGEMSANLMSEALTQELESLKAAMTDMAENFRTEFNGANGQLQTTIAGFDGILKGLEGTVQTTQTSVEHSVERLSSQEDVVASMDEAAGRLREAADGLLMMQETFAQSSQQNAEAAQAQERAAAANQSVAEQFETVSERLPDFRETMESAGESIREGAEAARDTYTALNEHQERWFEGIRVGLEGMRDRLNELIEAYGDAVEGETRRHMDSWTDAVEESLRKFSVQVESLDGAINELTESMEER